MCQRMTLSITTLSRITLEMGKTFAPLMYGLNNLFNRKHQGVTVDVLQLLTYWVLNPRLLLYC